MCWGVPRTTHVYLVEGYFCSKLMSLRNQVYSRFTKFIRKLQDCPNYEVSVLSRIFLRDAKSRIRKNIDFLSDITKVSVAETPVGKIKCLLPRREIPPNDMYRKNLLDTLLEARTNIDLRTAMNLNQDDMKKMIVSLCST